MQPISDLTTGAPQYEWIAASIVATSVGLVLTAGFLRKHPIGIHYLLAVANGLAAGILFLFLDKNIIAAGMNPAVWHNLLFVALLTWLARLLYYYAYSRTTVANVTVFSALTPVYAALLSPMAKEPLSAHQWCGIIIISSSVFLFFARKAWANWVISRAGGKLVFSFPVLCAFFSTLPTAGTVYFQKDAITLSSPLFVSFFVCAFSSLASFAMLLARPNKNPVKKDMSLLAPILAIALLQAAATLAFSLFISHGHPAVGQALQRLSSLLQIMLAHIFLRERLNTRWHLFCVGLSAMGIYVLTMPVF